MKDRERIMELEALLRQSRTGRTVVCTTPVLASEEDFGRTSFAMPRRSAALTTVAHIGTPPSLARPARQKPSVHTLFLNLNLDLRSPES
eukprot:9721095-Heterocapsa_arctica.AAC.1